MGIGGRAEKLFSYGLFPFTLNLFCGEQHLTNKKKPEKPFDAGEYCHSIQPSKTIDGIGSYWQWNRKNDPSIPIERDQSTEKALWIKHIEPILQKYDLKNDSGDRFEYRFFEKQITEEDVFEMLRKTMWLCRDIRFPKAGVSADVTNDLYGGADDFFLEIVRRLRDSDKGGQLFIKKDGGKIDLRDTFRDFLVSLFENKTLPEFLELFRRENPISEVEIRLIRNKNRKNETLREEKVKTLEQKINRQDYDQQSELIELAKDNGFIRLPDLVDIMAIDELYGDKVLSRLLKKYNCDKFLPKGATTHTVWDRLFFRWTSVVFDAVICGRVSMSSLSPIKLLPHYQRNEKTGALIKRGPDYFIDRFLRDTGDPFIMLSELKEYLTSYIKIELPAILFAKELEPPKKEKEKSKRLRKDQEDKEDCQKIASNVWERYPFLKIKYMKLHPKIKAITGRLYQPKTVHEWLSEVAPDDVKKPGRTSKKELKRQRHICNELGIKWPELTKN